MSKLMRLLIVSAGLGESVAVTGRNARREDRDVARVKISRCAPDSKGKCEAVTSASGR